jgi:hypothetical protein
MTPPVGLRSDVQKDRLDEDLLTLFEENRNEPFQQSPRRCVSSRCENWSVTVLTSANNGTH